MAEANDIIGKTKKVELVGTHTQKTGCKQLLHSLGMDTRRSKSEREAKDNLEKDGGKGKKQSGLEELGSSQRGGMECWSGVEWSVGVLVRKRDGLMHLLARQDMMMMKLLFILTCLMGKGQGKSSAN